MRKIRQLITRKTLTIILLLIFSEILCENFIVGLYNRQSYAQEFYLLLGYMFLQIIFAPVQAGFSDFIGRKKSIIFSLGATLISLLILFFCVNNLTYCLPLLLIATLIKGTFGNTLPLSLAAIADTQDKNYRFSFALSSGTYAISYLILIFSAKTINEVYFNYILTALIAVLIYVCIYAFCDAKDEEVEEKPKKRKRIPKIDFSFLKIIKHEPVLIIEDLKQVPTRRALTAFFLWEVSMYSILVSQVDFKIFSSSNFAATMMIGYLVGVGCLRFCYKIHDSKIIKLGYYISTFSLVPYFLFFYFTSKVNILLQVCYFFHALGNAFLSPAFMSIIAKEKPPHEQGKRYGLVDSIDTIGFLIATIVIMILRFFELNLFYLVSFSFITFLASWRYYDRFKKYS